MPKSPRSPHEKAGGMAYFPRLVEKIRLHAAGELPEDYHENLGGGADRRCTSFLRVAYEDLKARVLAGGTDEEVLQWCFEHGRSLDEDDLVVWNGFITKLGWRDYASEYLAEMKTEMGMGHRDDILTFTDVIELDEGRKT